MRIFSKSIEQEQRERKIAREDELLKRLILFPGSIQEYSAFMIYKVEAVDTERPDKGITLPSDDRELIVSLMDKKGVEALVNVSFKAHGGQYSTIADVYGLPVRRKKISPVDDHSHDLP